MSILILGVYLSVCLFASFNCIVAVVFSLAYAIAGFL